MTSVIPDRMTSAERRVFYDSSLLILTLFVGVELSHPGLSKAYAGWPLIASLFLAGMPHGAVDLAIARRLRKHHGLLGSRFGAYLAVLGLSAAFFAAAPLTAAGLFFVLSGVHFGLADARALDLRCGLHSPPVETALAAFVRGSLIISLPFLFHASESLQVVSNVVAVAGLSADWLSPSTTMLLAAAAVSVAVAALVPLSALRLGRRDGSPLATELGETAVLVAAFYFLHPLFAVGLYVAVWHSWRHLHATARFFRQGQSLSNIKECAQAVGGLHIRSLPLLVPTVAAFWSLAWLQLDSWAPEQLAALMIALFVVLTLPHHILVERLFRTEWRRIPKNAAKTENAVGAQTPLAVLPVTSVSTGSVR